MFSSLAIAAASIVAPSPSVAIPWFEFDDYPLDAIRGEIEGNSEVEVVVAPDGSPVACSVIRSTGAQVLDRQACAVTLRRARFQPARNAGLQPVYGTYRSQVVWALDPDKWTQIGPAPVLQMTLSRLPAGATSPLFIEYAVEVDSAGRPVGCAPVLPDLAALAQASCARLMKELPAMPVATATGSIPAVRSLWIAYSL